MSIVFIDLETTGLHPMDDFPTEIALVKRYTDGSKREEHYSSLMRIPKQISIPTFITEMTGITKELLDKEGKHRDTVRREIQPFFADNPTVVAHHAPFDLGFLEYDFGIRPANFVDTRSIATLLFPNRPASLEPLSKSLFPDWDYKQAHRAAEDITLLERVYDKMQELLDIDLRYYTNIVAVKDRELFYTPPAAEVIKIRSYRRGD
jgi:DNA polymerase III subunit epsilon